jgi:hypothetical protein
MRQFLLLSILLTALGLAAGCGPQKPFCPNVAADAGGVCPIFGDDAMAPVQDMSTGGGCPPGEGYAVVDGSLVCIPPK